ncbi:hypothetical protein NUACC21_03120 [Scytonema sp. NUACC21]
MLRQMCYLIEFDGVVARIAIKQAWYKKAQEDQPKIVAAFKATFKTDIKVNLELATTSNSTPFQTPSSQKKPTVAPQPPVNQEPPPNPPPSAKNAPAAPVSEAVQHNKTPNNRTPTPKMESVANAKAFQSSPPAKPPVPAVTWETDEGAIAAQRLAQFFDGEVIRLTDDTELNASEISSNWDEETEADEEL